MTSKIESMLKEATGARRVGGSEQLQSLWSGYGSIIRYELEEARCATAIVKQVSPPKSGAHPRGWNTDRSHQRKLKSYRVEAEWYRNFSESCEASCRVPRCLAVEQDGDELLLVLEDLDAAGFGHRRTRVSDHELAACLSWLAHFHATFLHVAADGLWPVGTYWHLETRPDELAVLRQEDAGLAEAAEGIDRVLRAARFQTLVHGDAKLANFCFSPHDASVAAVDFQYVGGGCGMKDVAYFIGSCLGEDDCAAKESVLLDLYFSALGAAMRQRGIERDIDALESEWRSLYPVAWTDFHRFLKGWSPGHWKLHRYSERLASEVVEEWKKGNLPCD
ncbi:choline kinase [Coraliomargarita sinensis]|uniref:Choline kinase n=1 Tax=Coraliomargarita sinensis TaxID=2174842 RepID=A0A317ZF96_9BACT|nr:phosphotransferase [Coraliomargarita sinensis]PXA04126.1 choline kinase [Coraliomargarita sinensis]